MAEVASIGGMVRQYQVVLDPVKLAGYGVTHNQAVDAIQRANQEAGGSVLEMGEAEYMVRASGYLRSLDDFRAIPLRTAAGGIAITLGDVATLQIGPEMRRGVAELNGQGEVAGGVVILRSGKNARETIAAVKDKLQELKRSLPSGVEVVTTYDRSQLIARSIRSRVSGSSKIFSDNTCSNREVASAKTLFTAGACFIERFSASRSRGLAVPRLSRPIRRSRSLTSFNRNRIFSRKIVSDNSVTAASRVCISLRLSEGRKSHCRKSLEPIPVTV